MSSQTAPHRLVLVWFVLDAFVAMFPPLYWFADGRTALILGVPGALLYFLAVSACITASLVAAHLLNQSKSR